MLYYHKIIEKSQTKLYFCLSFPNLLCNHRKKDFLKIQEYIHEGANLKLYIPEFFNFKLYIPEYSPI
jgi:hypothetical protein